MGSMRKAFGVATVMGVLAIVMTIGLTACKKRGDKSTKGSTASTEAPKQTVAEKAKVEFYIMSKCPFGVKVVEAIYPVLKEMGANVDFDLEFIGREVGGKLTSLHKEPEVKGNMLQICAAKYAPNAYLEFVHCMNRSWRKIPEGWESCAKETGMPMDKLRTCYEGQEGHDLLKASFDKAQRRRARGSPTMYIGGKLYRGGRSDKAFTRAICNAFPKDKPEVCASLPPPVKVPVTIISDERCKQCRTKMIEQQMQGFFPGAEIKVVDYGTDEGKNMFKELELKKLPVILFGQEVKEAENFARLQRSLRPMGDHLGFTRYARFDPTREICSNKKDDTGNGKVDCDDPDCTHALNCRKPIENKLELFVMSQCPYGTKALDAMKEVLDNFDNKIKFHVNFIASEEGDGFRALHGQPEVDENIRELCAIKHYSKNFKYMDYIWCRDKNIRSKDWQSCTGGDTGIKTDVIEKCFKGEEGKKLLRENIKIAEALNVTGSPTWYANNKFRFSGLDPETIKNNMCKHNKDLPNCDKKLTGPQKRKGGGGGGACR